MEREPIQEPVGREQSVLRALQRRYMRGARAEVWELEEEGDLRWFREEMRDGTYSEETKRVALRALAERLVRNGYHKGSIVTFFHGKMHSKRTYCWFVGVRMRKGSERL